MAAHGAGGSAFTDWWAYKFEVYDAIPQNGCLMQRAGVTTSFNSDSPRWRAGSTTEAAKAVQVRRHAAEHEALKFATLNRLPGSSPSTTASARSKPGKDADFVLWSGHPLSTQSRVEETWIDGALYFSRTRDAELRAADAAERRLLVQKALAAPPKKEKKEKEGGAGGVRPAEGWSCDDLGDIRTGDEEVANER